MRIVDKKCEVCGKVFEDVILDEEIKCCSKIAQRLFGYRKYSEFIPGYYSHFTHEDIYLDSPEAYARACKKYHVDQMGGKGLYQRQYK